MLKEAQMLDSGDRILPNFAMPQGAVVLSSMYLPDHPEYSRTLVTVQEPGLDKPTELVVHDSARLHVAP